MTWVLSGVLLHTDSTGHTSPIGPGTVQAMSAGSGIRHAEVADPASGRPASCRRGCDPTPGGVPEHHELAVDLEGSGLVASPGPGGLPDLVRRAPPCGSPGSLRERRSPSPTRRRVHVFAATGARRPGGLATGPEADPGQPPSRLSEGDAFRSTDEPGRMVTAAAYTDLLVWTSSR